MYPDSAQRAQVQSYARIYPEGVSLVTPGRPSLKSVSIQNRDNKTIYFWHGRMPSGTTGQGAFLPVDPVQWTAQQKLDAATMMLTYGEAIAASQTYEPRIAQTSALYSYVTVGTAVAHVKAGN
jgi:hypothetical protein